MWFARFARFLLRQLRRTVSVDLSGLAAAERERARLAARGITDPTVQRYLAWRGSVCLVAGLLAFPHAVSYALTSLEVYTSEPSIWSAVGLLAGVGRVVAAFALPAAGLAGALFWARPRVSHPVLLAGWLTSFLLPILVSFVPPHALFDLDALNDPSQGNVLRVDMSDDGDVWVNLQIGALPRPALELVLDAAGGLFYGLLLLPAVLSLLPGTVQACLRVKFLMPHSVVPGWFLVAAAPAQTLLLLVAFVTVVHWVDRPLLVTGLALMLAAPLVYLANTRLFVQALPSGHEIRKLRLTRLAFAAASGVGLVLVAFDLERLEIPWEDRVIRLVGLDPDTSLIQPWDLLVFVVEYLGRALLLTVVVADLLLRINLSVWRQTRALAGHEGEGGYPALMDNLAAALDRPQ
jgi:hypothetical protein